MNAKALASCCSPARRRPRPRLRRPRHRRRRLRRGHRPGRRSPSRATTAPHPDFRIEWWYVTANLDRPRRRRLRRAVDALPPGHRPRRRPPRLGRARRSGWPTPPPPPPPPTASPRPSPAAASARPASTLAPFRAWIDDWSDDRDRRRRRARRPAPARPAATASPTTSRSPPTARRCRRATAASASSPSAARPPTTTASPSTRVDGTLTLDGRDIPVTGTGLARPRMVEPARWPRTRHGWDWFALHLDDGAQRHGLPPAPRTRRAYLAGTWIDARRHRRTPLRPDQIAATPGATGRGRRPHASRSTGTSRSPTSASRWTPSP